MQNCLEMKLDCHLLDEQHVWMLWMTLTPQTHIPVIKMNLDQISTKSINVTCI